MVKRLILFFATGFGSGSLPCVPGTFGTLVGAGLYLLIKDLSGISYLATVLTLTFFAAWVSAEAARQVGKKDPSEVVIDEIAGLCVTMAFVKFSWMHLIAGFALFRLFDVWKPYPCRWIQDRVPGGWGIVGDDLMAGVYANLLLHLLSRFL
ncbi:MAG: phosphatidylglycerophosphatase A [Deltaproteobacteria bacterium]|nr:phosphatidylglycerophosphatase A [Deltaproteobacteria bacterium]